MKVWRTFHPCGWTLKKPQWLTWCAGSRSKGHSGFLFFFSLRKVEEEWEAEGTSVEIYLFLIVYLSLSLSLPLSLSPSLSLPLSPSLSLSLPPPPTLSLYLSISVWLTCGMLLTSTRSKWLPCQRVPERRNLHGWKWNLCLHLCYRLHRCRLRNR